MERRNPLVKITCLALCAVCVLGANVARADQTTASVQQALKEQGFYYGAIDGQKNSETTAALRRYQIRNGLQITGEIDAETLRSLGVGAGREPTAPAPRPVATPNEPANEDDNAGQSADIPQPAPNNAYPRPGPPIYNGVMPRGGPPVAAGVFAGTPYEMAPPDLQRHVIVGVQTLLARYGYYRSGIDGEFGPGTSAAVRAFQSRARLIPDGRLNMETLGALGLLPGQQRRYLPYPAFQGRPVYRGQWIPD